MMRSMNDIYNLVGVFYGGALRNVQTRLELFPPDRRKIRRLAALRFEQPWMNVVRIQYASPGALDVAGIGTLAGHVKEFLLGIIDRWQTKSLRRVELQQKLLQAESMRFQNDHERERNLALVRREEELHTVELTSRKAEVREKEAEAQALAIANFEQASKFAAGIVGMSRDVGLNPAQVLKLATLVASRESPVRELVELGQIVDVKEKDQF